MACSNINQILFSPSFFIFCSMQNLDGALMEPNLQLFMTQRWELVFKFQPLQSRVFLLYVAWVRLGAYNLDTKVRCQGHSAHQNLESIKFLIFCHNRVSMCHQYPNYFYSFRISKLYRLHLCVVHSEVSYNRGTNFRYQGHSAHLNLELIQLLSFCHSRLLINPIQFRI